MCLALLFSLVSGGMIVHPYPVRPPLDAGQPALYSTPGPRADADPLPVLVQPQPCAHDFQTLIRQLLPALPAYANRALVRAGHPQDYFILASQPDFKPLSPAAIATLNLPTAPATFVGLHQVFFTTLRRQYISHRSLDQQAYHWLLLKAADHDPQTNLPTATPPRQWQLVRLYTIPGHYPQGTTALSPIQDHRHRPLAQAIQQWLRDRFHACSLALPHPSRTLHVL